ncbi:glutaminyl-peptide cyclotransferase-like protein [Exaiptasia diaphana]|uniref:Glutaminyl-peptide cyclotransferase n=1 Tax=Exaiptasia diaphana TaxID=2652724 RepID=A0A913YS92_EXADI|nr:glutaminyl-peptide cyclotransferase-like protein [Exaiptasia diaphana]KXJ07582.1 Glutaminyl-peptide cyclotransferase-like protein [Exaiptasia diaphana]
MCFKTGLFMIAILVVIVECSKLRERRTFRKLRTLPQSSIIPLSGLTEYDTFYRDILRPIMKVRVSGTENHSQVRKFIKKQFEDLKWYVTEDVFDAVTPYGNSVTFKNIIATLNPTAQTRHVMSAHYDSKFFNNTDKEFLGAIDSAVPCAMLIELARTLTPLFRKKGLSNVVTLQMVFFDGEEAFKEWSKTDSLYGSRHLAWQWENTQDDFMPQDATASVLPNLLDSVNSLILLDLLGSAAPKIYDMHPPTTVLFQELRKAEDILNAAGQLEDYNHFQRYFQYSENSMQIYVEDDHIPFMERDVPILHLIPVPFPECWHKFCDNYGALHNATIHNLIKIMRVFTVHLFSL